MNLTPKRTDLLSGIFPPWALEFILEDKRPWLFCLWSLARTQPCKSALLPVLDVFAHINLLECALRHPIMMHPLAPKSLYGQRRHHVAGLFLV